MVETKQPLETGGFGQIFDLKFSILVAPFLIGGITTAEALREIMLNTPIGYLGASYKIEAVTVYPTGLVMTIGANALNTDA